MTKMMKGKDNVPS